MRAKRPFADPAVRAAFDAYPRGVRAGLLALRALIFEAATEHEAIGPLTETLKWGQPAYLQARPRIGTTVRIDALDNRRYALLVHCQTSLTARFRETYPSLFEIDGKRAVVFATGAPLPRDELKHCIAIALTYHMLKSRNQSGKRVEMPD